MLLIFSVGCTVDPEVNSVMIGVEQTAITTSAPMAITQPQLIEFYANWCPVCQSMQPTVENVRTRYGDALLFTHLDIDDPSNEALRQQYGYRVQPYFVLLDGYGNVVQTWHGAVTAEAFEQAINPLMAVGN